MGYTPKQAAGAVAGGGRLFLFTNEPKTFQLSNRWLISFEPSHTMIHQPRGRHLVAHSRKAAAHIVGELHIANCTSTHDQPFSKQSDTFEQWYRDEFHQVPLKTHLNSPPSDSHYPVTIGQCISPTSVCLSVSPTTLRIMSASPSRKRSFRPS